MDKSGHGPVITPQRLQNDSVHLKIITTSALLCNFTKTSDFTSDIWDIFSNYDFLILCKY